jgi:hypothetical protein
MSKKHLNWYCNETGNPSVNNRNLHFLYEFFHLFRRVNCGIVKHNDFLFSPFRLCFIILFNQLFQKFYECKSVVISYYKCIVVLPRKFNGTYKSYRRKSFQICLDYFAFILDPPLLHTYVTVE